MTTQTTTTTNLYTLTLVQALKEATTRYSVTDGRYIVSSSSREVTVTPTEAQVALGLSPEPFSYTEGGYEVYDRETGAVDFASTERDTYYMDALRAILGGAAKGRRWRVRNQEA